ncbi:serine hydrolase [Sarcoptes scabiei]|nr:serine hydrolase [Sarcoptes scabiei]
MLLMRDLESSNQNNPNLSEFKRFDIITRVNGILIENLDDWHQVLEQFTFKKVGLCLNQSSIQSLIESNKRDLNPIVDYEHYLSCRNDRHLPFLFEHEEFNRFSEIRRYLKSIKSSKLFKTKSRKKNFYNFCLPIRQMIQYSKHFCSDRGRNCLDSNKSMCFLPEPDRYFNGLFVIEINERRIPEIIYWGSSSALNSSIQLSKTGPSPLIQNLSEQYELLFTYLFLSSVTMMMINSLPMKPLDGYQILSILAESSKQSRQQYRFTIMMYRLILKTLEYATFLLGLLYINLKAKSLILSFF